MSLKKLLISGGTGFLGAQIARSLRSEYDVYLASRSDYDESQLRQANLNGCKSVVMDVTDPLVVRNVFQTIAPDVVIHAAASKSVGHAEVEALECVDVNLLGSQNIARAAMEFESSIVIGISSNRAAPPTNDTYGLTKATMERMFCSLNGKTATKFSSVRLGNIAWSTGSVLPIWQGMLDDTSIIGSAGPECRKMITNAEEAVDIVRTCLDRIEEFQGKVLARRAKQVLIKDLLDQFIDLKGGTWEQLERRLGEKTEEVLIGDLELPYCEEISMGGVTHYLIGFNDKARNPVREIVSTNSVEELSVDDIRRLINEQPTVSPAAEVQA